jgi:hypothetical protein
MRKLIIAAALLLAACSSSAEATDPRFPTCAEATAAGHGPYTSSESEFAWYDDADHDGTVCEGGGPDA